MLKHRILTLTICLGFICSCIPAFAEDIVGTPYDGTAVDIASSGTTTIYAAKKNKDASDTGAEVYDTHNNRYTIETNIEAMAVKAAENDVSWYYTVNVAKAGLYKIDILGWSGWVDSLEATDGGGRFSFEIGGTKIADGTGSSPVILPPWGNGTAYGGLKGEYEFTDDDKISLGEFQLNAGEQIIKITADNNAGACRMGISRIYFTAMGTVEGDPWSGEAVTIASAGTTTIYAARKNKHASDSGAVAYDVYEGSNTVEANPENMAMRATENGASWYYTVNVAKAGLYKIDILGWSGWVNSLEATDGGGRFSFEIDGTKIADGAGSSPVILPPWGSGHKEEYQFTDNDKTSLGEFQLNAGEQIIKITADDNAGDCRMGISRIYFTGPDSVEGEPWSGEPVKVSSEGTTQIYAARKNKCALDSDAVVYDIYQWENTVVDNPEKMAVKANADGVSWYYTIDVEKTGLYKIDILGWSGYASSAETTDGGGRFSFEIGGTKLVDGKGDSPVILPPWGDGTASGSNKGEYEFTDEDKINIGTYMLNEGEQVIKITADNHASAHMGFNKIYFKGIPMLAGLNLTSETIVARGETQELKYDYEWSFEGEDAIEPTLIWNSSDTSVCTVADGVVTGVAKGNAIISLQATDGWNTFNKQCAVEVNVEASSVSVNVSDISLSQGQSYTVTAQVLPADTDDKTIIWRSSNNAVASVSGGVITANEAGIAQITASCGTVSDTVNVTVGGNSGGGGVSSGGGGGGGGGVSSGGGGGGGGFRYVGEITADTQADANYSKVTNGTVGAMKSAELKKILEEYNSVIYSADTNSVSGEINGDFFREYPGSKSLMFEMPSGTIIIGADALNKADTENIDSVNVKLSVSGDNILIELSVNDSVVSDFNGAVSVKLAAYDNKSYSIINNEKEIKVEYTNDKAIFAANGSGTYNVVTMSNQYADADNTPWAAPSIYTALEKGVLKPNSREEFGADDNAGRGEIVYAIVNGLGLTSENSDGFDDVAAGHEYANEISVAKTLKIVNGVDGKNFMPDEFISRQDVAVILYRALQLEGEIQVYSVQPFSDDDMISDYAKEAVYSLTGMGYFKGRDNGFAPLGKMTKAELAVLLGRICNW